jgi:hypothetical protein
MSAGYYGPSCASSWQRKSHRPLTMPSPRGGEEAGARGERVRHVQSRARTGCCGRACAPSWRRRWRRAWTSGRRRRGSRRRSGGGTSSAAPIDHPARFDVQELARVGAFPPRPDRQRLRLSEQNTQDGAGVEVDIHRWSRPARRSATASTTRLVLTPRIVRRALAGRVSA